MMLHEAVMKMQERPELLAISPLGQVIRLSGSGYLTPAFKVKREYCRLRAIEMLAVTWTVYTEDQLREMAEQSAQG